MAEETEKEGIKVAEEGLNKGLRAEEAQRESLAVGQKEPERNSVNVGGIRRNLTFEQYQAEAKRGTLKVGEDEFYKDKYRDKLGDKITGELENTNAGDPKRYKPEKKDKGKFKEQDIIEYMYNEWFLEGLSWGFNQIESGFEGFALRLSEGIREGVRNCAVATQKVASKSAEEFLAKVSALGAIVTAEAGQYEGACEGQKQKYRNIIGELDVDYGVLEPAKEKTLKEKYSESFINRLKEHYAQDAKKVKKFFEVCPKELDAALDTLKTVHKISTSQVQVEMQDEAMHDHTVWLDKETRAYKTDDVLKSELKARIEKRKREILTAVSTVSEDARLWAEAKYSVLPEEEKEKFMKENVLDVYDQKIAAETDKKAKEDFIVQKAKFEKEFEEKCPSGKITREAEVYMFRTMSSFKVNDYLKEQMVLTAEAQELQNKEILEGHYQANGRKPDKAVRKIMVDVQERTSEVIEQGLSDDKLFAEENLKEKVKVRRSLFEEGLIDQEGKAQKVLESMRLIHENEAAILTQRRENLKERVENFKKHLEQIQLDNNQAPKVFAFARADGGR